MTPRRALVVAAFCFSYPVFWLVIKAGWVADAMRKAARYDPPVKAPIFIVGNFRSGTTYLHRLLAGHPDLATMKLWEILFAPSRSARQVLGPLFRAWSPSRTSGPIHTTGWLEAEEDDYLHLFHFDALTVGMSSGLTGLALPHVHCDSEKNREAVGYYHQCVARFLSMQPQGKRYLSKNPALTPKMEAVAEAFPDARFVVIERNPEDVLASLSRMMNITWAAIGARANSPLREKFLRDIVKLFSNHPRQLASGALAGRIHFVPYDKLVSDPAKVVADICTFCGMPAYLPAI
jgi:omega-hydroxy-beta-dihydromenaquinone-9 sulfotransferase